MDGSVEKVARPINGDNVFSINSINNSIEQVNVKSTLQTIELSSILLFVILVLTMVYLQTVKKTI